MSTPTTGRTRARRVLEGSAESVLRTMLRFALVPAAAATVVVTVVCWLGWGPPAGAGALVGAAVTMLTLAIGLLALKAVLNGPSTAALAGALLVYLVELGVLFAVLLVLRGLEWVHPGGFAAGALTATVVWQVGHIVGLSRARRLVFDPPSAPANRPTGGQ